MIKPGKHDIPVKVLIQGAELDALQDQAWQLAETFGLDRRICQYRGTRPLQLYRWDLEALIDMLVPGDGTNPKPRLLADRAALSNLRERLLAIYEANYTYPERAAAPPKPPR